MEGWGGWVGVGHYPKSQGSWTHFQRVTETPDLDPENPAKRGLLRNPCQKLAGPLNYPSNKLEFTHSIIWVEYLKGFLGSR